ncbi:MAG: glycosyltransferase [Azonexaceae bacterium]|nr:glycosyltransferase [Azonexaceae bacterium]
MKVLLAIPGHLKTVPMGQYCADALRQLGHEVIVADFCSQWHDKLRERVLLSRSAQEEKPTVNARIRRLAESVRPDAFITLFGFDLSPQTLEHLRKLGIPTACWWINDPFQFNRSLKKAPFYDFLFSNSAGSTEAYRAAGVHNAHFLPTACVPEIHRTVAPVPAYACDVCFAGDWSPLREQMMLQLVDRFDLRIFGPWRKKLPADSPLHAKLTEGFFTPDKMAQMFNSAAIVLNLHTWFESYDHGLNPRLFEAAGCGALQIVDWKREIPSLFKENDEVITYRKLSDVGALIGELLRDRSACQAIGHAAQARAHSQHAYAHRMADMLKTMAA